MSTQAPTGGRVALVTGGGTGIGFSAARALARDGFHVVVSGRRRDVLEAAVKRLRAVGAASSVQADVGTNEDPAGTVDQVVARHGRIDCLVTAAAVFQEAPLLEMTHQQWDETMNINLRGTWLSAQAAARHMVKQGHGRMVLIGSIAAVQSEGETAGHYSVSKAGVHSLAQTLGVVLAPRGIQVNAVAPGLIETPMTAALLEQADPATIAEYIPTGRACQADEVGELVRFLAADAPPSLVGSIITIDSGQTAEMRLLRPRRI
jgi:NAD(P)-dependent dehydrogenase (short-subunit alcohol dehydrogenase family)